MGIGEIHDMEWNTIDVKLMRDVCFIQLNRFQEKNTINAQMISEIEEALDLYEEECKIFVFEGNEEYFCFGADFNAINEEGKSNRTSEQNPGRLFDLWKRMTCSSCIMIAHVRGSVNAGGVGFVCACDIVIASESATFSLSELLFGLMPAMVLPFLIQKIGSGHSRYMTLSTKPISAKTACEWGLVDICSEQSSSVLRQHLARMTKIPKDGVAHLKSYMDQLSGIDEHVRQKAIHANLEVFSDPTNLNRIYEFTQKGIYPWEG